MFTIARILCPFSFLCFNPPSLEQCPTSCDCYQASDPESASLICGNIEENQLNSIKIHTLAFANITFDDRVIYGSELRYTNFEHLSFDSCGGAAQVTNNRPDRFVHDDSMIQPNHSSLTITNSRHVSEWKWTSFEFRQIHMENCSLYAFHSPILNRKFVDKVFGVRAQSISIIGCKIGSIASGAFSQLVELRYLKISKNKFTAIKRDVFASYLSDLWYIDLSHNQLESITDDFFQGMPSLAEVDLAGNLLTVIPWDLVRPVWQNLNYFDIRGNKINCETLCWAFNQTLNSRPVFLGDTDCQFDGMTFTLAQTGANHLGCDLSDLTMKE